MPYADFVRSAQSLDNQRLGKQRVETYQILRVLAGITNGWANHPAVKMWRGHELSLIEYGQAVCLEWRARGYKDTCLEKISDLAERFEPESAKEPEWLGIGELHLSHQSNLIRKAPEYYAAQFPNVPSDLPYVWF